MSGTLLDARDVTRSLAEGVTLVRDVNLAVGQGEFVAVSGPSGSGKSSLLYLLGLLDRPSTGQVLLEGRDTARLSGKEMAALRLARIGFVFQFHFLLPEFSAIDNVLIPIRRLGRLSDPAAREHAMKLLDRLGLADAAAVFDIFAQLVAQEGRTVIVVTHDTDLAARATRRVHLVDGRIVSDQPSRPVTTAGPGA